MQFSGKSLWPRRYQCFASLPVIPHGIHGAQITASQQGVLRASTATLLHFAQRSFEGIPSSLSELAKASAMSKANLCAFVGDVLSECAFLIVQRKCIHAGSPVGRGEVAKLVVSLAPFILQHWNELVLRKAWVASVKEHLSEQANTSKRNITRLRRHVSKVWRSLPSHALSCVHAPDNRRDARGFISRRAGRN